MFQREKLIMIFHQNRLSSIVVLGERIGGVWAV